MSLHRYAKQRDLNEPEIISALQQCGCDVERIDLCDLIVGRAGVNYLLEIKRPDRRSESRIKPRQKRMRSTWSGQYAIVTTVAEALKAVGL
jgi:hypothetical protein